MNQHPTIHINGSNPQTMIHDLSLLAQHLRDARERLKNVAPHMRDYYVKPDGGNREFEAARLAHSRRMRAIDLVLDEIEEMHIAIVDQLLDTPGARDPLGGPK